MLDVDGVGYDHLECNREGKKEKNSAVLFENSFLNCIFWSCGRWAAKKGPICLRSNEFKIVADVTCDLEFGLIFSLL